MSLRRASFLLGLSALFSRLLGVLRDHLLAKTFGATSGTGLFNLDAYYAAFRIPDLLYNLLIFGAVSAAFVPLFTQYKKEKKLSEAWVFASNLLHVLLLIMGVFSLLAYLFAPFLTHLVGSGFDAQTFETTTQLMRILLLSPLLFTVSAVFIGIQDSFKAFFFRALAPLFYNAGIILGILLWGQNYGVKGVTWGVILGAFIQLLIQLPGLKKLAYRHVWLLDFKRPDLKKSLKLMLPRVLGLSLNQLTLIFHTFMASFLVTGSITVFYFADNLQALPLGVLSVSVAIASFATFSELAMEKSPKAFTQALQKSMKQVLFLLLPAAMGLFLLRFQVIDLILVGGQFTPEDGNMTATVLSWFLLSAFAQGLIPLLARGFYAYHHTWFPFFAALFGAFLSVLGAALSVWVWHLGIAGIAASFSLGMLVQFIFLYVFMQRHCQQALLDLNYVLKLIFTTGVMGLSVWGLNQVDLSPFAGALGFLFLGLKVLVGAGVYFFLAKRLHIMEIRPLFRHTKKI